MRFESLNRLPFSDLFGNHLGPLRSIAASTLAWCHVFVEGVRFGLLQCAAWLRNLAVDQKNQTQLTGDFGYVQSMFFCFLGMTKSGLCFFLGGEWPGVTHTQLCGYTPWFLGPNLDTQGPPPNNKAILGISNIRIILIHPHPMAGYFDPRLRLKPFGDGHWASSILQNGWLWNVSDPKDHRYGLTQSHLNTEP